MRAGLRCPAGCDPAIPEKGSMVEPRETRNPLPRAWTLATVAVVGLAAVGCTMCPDPFDYSGPVPNGSAPQNDFRARSGGILPLGAAPHPWPLIVKGEEQPDEPTPTGEVVGEVVDEPVVETGEEELRQTVAVVGEAEERSEVASNAPAATMPPARLEPVPAAVTVPPLPIDETPGWRARRR